MSYFSSVKSLPREEFLAPGHRACQGCMESLAIRLILKGIGPNCVVATATGCAEVTTTPYPYTAWRVPWIHVAFENAAAVASGIEAAFKALMRKGRLEKEQIHVIALAGDGGTADIGFQALSGALERWHDFVYVCLDNEAYMNTGIQRSSATPYGAWTTTSPVGRRSKGKPTWKKDVAAIVMAHRIPYVATATPAYPIDLVNKARRAAEVEGPAYLHVYCSCPPGWRLPSDKALEVLRLGVESGVLPIYEVVEGELRVTVKPLKRKPVAEYLKMQGRFAHLTEADVELIQRHVDEVAERLGLPPRA
ncbi:MAG: pyruvate synthase subunit PorB [Candidatus Nezhaarchaeota archaeon]|nr:pyruvate synthase subunit PorB [Candidatus Nezhaarchaeota archaeon]